MNRREAILGTLAAAAGAALPVSGDEHMEGFPKYAPIKVLMPDGSTALMYDIESKYSFLRDGIGSRDWACGTIGGKLTACYRDGSCGNYWKIHCQEA